MAYQNGTYEVEVIDETFGENHNGKPCVVLDCKILGKDIGEENLEECEEGTRAIRFYFVSEANARISTDQLRQIGYKGSDFPADFVNKKSGLIGTFFSAKCTNNEYGEQWNVAGGGGGGVSQTKASATKVAEVKAQYGHFFKKDAKAAQNSTAPKADPNSPAANNGGGTRRRTVAAKAGDANESGSVPF